MSVLKETPLALWVRQERAKALKELTRPNRYRLAKIAMSDDLSPWEQRAVATLLKARKFSKAQHRLFAELWAKYGRGQ